MKQLDIDSIANKEFKISDKEMINNWPIHMLTLIRANHPLDNLTDLPNDLHEHCNLLIIHKEINKYLMTVPQ